MNSSFEREETSCQEVNVSILACTIMKSSPGRLLSAGVRGEPQQDAAHRRHPAQEPDQADRVPEQLPEGSHGRRAVQRREDLPNQADQRSEEARLLEERPSPSPDRNFLINRKTYSRETKQKRKNININGYSI